MLNKRHMAILIAGLAVFLLLSSPVSAVLSYSISVQPISPSSIGASDIMSRLSSQTSSRLQEYGNYIGVRNETTPNITPLPTTRPVSLPTVNPSSIGSISAYTDVYSGDPNIEIHDRVSVDGQIFMFSYTTRYTSGM